MPGNFYTFCMFVWVSKRVCKAGFSNIVRVLPPQIKGGGLDFVLLLPRRERRTLYKLAVNVGVV